jgi:hypothetical protein
MDNEKDTQNECRLIPGRERFFPHHVQDISCVHPFFHPIGTGNFIFGAGKGRLNSVNKTYNSTSTVCTCLHTLHMNNCI